jgi:hypothetical protein
VKPELTVDQMADRYVKLRDKIAEIKKVQAEELGKYTSLLDTLGNCMLDRLNQAGVESMRTKAGTLFKTVRTSCRVEDWALTLAFIREHEAFDLLEARVSKTAAVAIIEDTQQPVPGVAITQEIVLNVRRPTAR